MELLKEITILEAYVDEIEMEIDADLDGLDLSEDDWDDICDSIDGANLFDDGDTLNESHDHLSEAAKRAVKRMGKTIQRYFRCSGGPKAGKLVADPSSCSKRKDPKKVRQGRKVAKQKRGIRVMKTKMAKRQTISKMVTKMNRRLSGK